VVNTDQIDLLHDQRELSGLLNLLKTPFGGTQYYVSLGGG
jgi:hypothetical protein